VATEKKTPKKERKKVVKAHEYHPIYKKMDEKMLKGTQEFIIKQQEEKIRFLENEQELRNRGMVDSNTSRSALPKESKKTQPYNAAFVRVLGVSFTDYAEVKYMGSDGINDPWIQKGMGINIPKNYLPKMTQQPINVDRDSEGVLTVKKYTATDYKNMGKPMTASTEIDIFTGATKKIGSFQKRIIWPKYYQNPYQYQDYVYLQDIYANTICGRIFDTIG